MPRDLLADEGPRDLLEGLPAVQPSHGAVLFDASRLHNLRDLALGAVKGAGNIGSTLIRPFESADENAQRRASVTGGLQALGADPSSGFFTGGQLGAEVLGTLGVGGGLGKAASMLPGVPARVVNALRTSGFSTGAAPAGLGQRAGDVALRTAAGAGAGGAAAGLVDPENAGLGALIGGAVPGAIGAAGVVGKGIGESLRGKVSPEVEALAKRAKELGVDIPVDRLFQSKPLDAVASGLNYMPFSGRAATEARMGEQLNRAASRTFGQDSSNVTQALRRADSELGGQFDRFLKSNTVAMDQQFITDLAEAANKAAKELGADGASIIGKQVDEIIAKGAAGEIDGQAAYNIKKTLDRIGRRNSPEAWYALELKRTLMDALNRSVGTAEAQGFAQLRQHYGNMLELQKLAKNGVEGELSVARLANMKNINNEPLQEIADIAAQFVKPREAQHGAMQRAVAALTAGTLGGVPGLLGVAALGRSTNSLLDSGALRGLLTGAQSSPSALPWDAMGQFGYRAAPLLGGGR